MATVPSHGRTRKSNIRAGTESPWRKPKLDLDDMIDAIQLLGDHFAAQPDVHVCGNLLLYYEEGNPRKHVSPDVFVALDVPKQPPRYHYPVWKEGKAPDFVVEITSKSTQREDRKKKFGIYRDILGSGILFVRPDRGLPLSATPGLSAVRGGLCSHRTGRRPIAQSGAGSAPRT